MTELGALEKDCSSTYASLCFIILKQNRNVRFITDLRQASKQIVRKPFSLSKITDAMQRLQGFKHGTILDLSIGYYYARLGLDAQKSCPIIYYKANANTGSCLSS